MYICHCGWNITKRLKICNDDNLKTIVKEALGMKSAEPDNRLVGIYEACEILRRKKSTVYHMMRNGVLPHYKVGKMKASQHTAILKKPMINLERVYSNQLTLF